MTVRYYVAGTFQPGLWRQRENRIGNQRIMDDDIGLAQGIGRMQGQQARITRPCAHQPYGTRIKTWADEAGKIHRKVKS